MKCIREGRVTHNENFGPGSSDFTMEEDTGLLQQDFHGSHGAQIDIINDQNLRPSMANSVSGSLQALVVHLRTFLLTFLLTTRKRVTNHSPL